MLSYHIRHITIDYSTCQKIWKFTFIHFTLCGTLCVSTDSSIPIDLVIDAGLCIAWPNFGSHMDM